MPVYPLLLTMLDRPWKVIFLQLAAYLLAAAAIYAYLTWGGRIHPFRAALAALLFLLFPINSHFVYLIQPDSILISALTIGVCCYLSGHWLFAALIFATCCLTKYSMVIPCLMLPIACLVYDFFRHRRSDHARRREVGWHQHLISVLIVVSATGIWWTRNFANDLPALGSNRLINYYIGNNEHIRIEEGGFRFFDWKNDEFFRIGHEAEDSREKYQQAKKWVSEQTLSTRLSLGLNKFLAVFTFLPQLEDFWRYSPVGRIGCQPLFSILWLILMTLFHALPWVAFAVSTNLKTKPAFAAVAVTSVVVIAHLPYFLFGRLVAQLVGLWIVAAAINWPRTGRITGVAVLITLVLLATAHLWIYHGTADIPAYIEWFLDRCPEFDCISV